MVVYVKQANAGLCTSKIYVLLNKYLLHITYRLLEGNDA